MSLYSKTVGSIKNIIPKFPRSRKSEISEIFLSTNIQKAKDKIRLEIVVQLTKPLLPL
jgi:hypothetical protein